MSEAEMSAIRNVCVYCGSSDGDDARFGAAAEDFGRALAAGVQTFRFGDIATLSKRVAASGLVIVGSLLHTAAIFCQPSLK